MNPEAQAPQPSPEHQPHWTRRVFDFTQLTAAEIAMLGEAVRPPSDFDEDLPLRYQTLMELYENELAHLPATDLVKAEQVIDELARGSIGQRGAAGIALEPFLYAALEADDYDVMPALQQWVRLLNEGQDWTGIVQESALVAMCTAIESGRLPPEIAAWLSERVNEAT
ncbi:MAG: hypothetical protein ACT4RN_01775 [Pseudonocardia sp.]